MLIFVSMTVLSVRNPCHSELVSESMYCTQCRCRNREQSFQFALKFGMTLFLRLFFGGGVPCHSDAGRNLSKLSKGCRTKFGMTLFFL